MRIHHVGYIVKNIDLYAQSLPGLVLENRVHDPLQHADLALYKVGDGSYIELIQPISEKAFTWAHLAKYGETMHHICYEGVAIEHLDQLLKKHRMMKIRGPIHAILFNRDVVFAVTRQRAIVEFLL